MSTFCWKGKTGSMFSRLDENGVLKTHRWYEKQNFHLRRLASDNATVQRRRRAVIGKPTSIIDFLLHSSCLRAGKTLGPALIRCTPQRGQELEVCSSELGTDADISSNQDRVLGVGVLQPFSKRSDVRMVGAVCSHDHPTLTMRLKRRSGIVLNSTFFRALGLLTRCIFCNMNAIMSLSPSLPNFEPLECQIRSQQLVEHPFTPSSHDLIIFAQDGKPRIAKNALPSQMVNALQRSNSSCGGGHLDADGHVDAPLTIMYDLLG